MPASLRGVVGNILMLWLLRCLLLCNALTTCGCRAAVSLAYIENWTLCGMSGRILASCENASFEMFSYMLKKGIRFVWLRITTSYVMMLGIKD